MWWLALVFAVPAIILTWTGLRWMWAWTRVYFRGLQQ
jgi:hypothetical protein